ncbi:uncharacterized protein LOC133710928 [Rosa rugosa]|uniref:uncharacterized protein LOC133710928 n=1 Tax=Rosa rugosa TaxID=74645 RepID=UPI002B402A3C|nr:uncharacterized protein LOC133710928 [Rosa rugosa]
MVTIFLHIGLVQIGVKPLTRKGLNASILLCLRDARFTDFNDSTLGIIESSLFNSPIHFDCYPDFTISLSDPHILKSLTLNIKTLGYNVLEGTQPLALIYRIHYKVTGTKMNFQAISKSPKDQTLLIQSSQENANIRVPHTFRWSDVHLPSEWSLTSENQPINIQHNLSDLNCIQQYNDDIVRINFHNPRLSQHLRIHELGQSSRHSFTASRHYFVGSTSAENMSRQDCDLDKEIKNIRIKELEEELQKLKIKNLQTTSQVSYPSYAETQLVLDDEQTSPTATDFEVVPPINPQLSTLSRPFTINYSKLDKDLESAKNILRRNLYRKQYPLIEQRKQLFKNWQAFILETQSENFFLDFIDQQSQKNIQTLTKAKWKTPTNSIVSSSHPFVETIVIDHLQTPITASPFKIARDDPEIKKTIEQNNYTNQSLVTIGNQLDKIETKVDNIFSKVSILP